MSTANTLREQIADFQAAYIRCIDTDQLEAWPEFFVPDCLYSVTTLENHRQGLPAGLIWANSQAMLRDRVSALRHANIYERQSYRHIIGQTSIVSDAEGALRTETPFMVARIMHDGTTDLYSTGVYHDEFAQGVSPLRLRRRIVVCDSSRIDTLLALPL